MTEPARCRCDRPLVFAGETDCQKCGKRWGEPAAPSTRELARVMTEIAGGARRVSGGGSGRPGQGAGSASGQRSRLRSR